MLTILAGISFGLFVGLRIAEGTVYSTQMWMDDPSLFEVVLIQIAAGIFVFAGALGGSVFGSFTGQMIGEITPQVENKRIFRVTSLTGMSGEGLIIEKRVIDRMPTHVLRQSKHKYCRFTWFDNQGNLRMTRVETKYVLVVSDDRGNYPRVVQYTWRLKHGWTRLFAIATAPWYVFYVPVGFMK